MALSHREFREFRHAGSAEGFSGRRLPPAMVLNFGTPELRRGKSDSPRSVRPPPATPQASLCGSLSRLRSSNPLMMGLSAHVLCRRLMVAGGEGSLPLVSSASSATLPRATRLLILPPRSRKSRPPSSYAKPPAPDQDQRLALRLRHMEQGALHVAELDVAILAGRAASSLKRRSRHSPLERAGASAEEQVS